MSICELKRGGLDKIPTGQVITVIKGGKPIMIRSDNIEHEMQRFIICWRSYVKYGRPEDLNSRMCELFSIDESVAPKNTKQWTQLVKSIANLDDEKFGRFVYKLCKINKPIRQLVDILRHNWGLVIADLLGQIKDSKMPISAKTAKELTGVDMTDPFSVPISGLLKEAGIPQPKTAHIMNLAEKIINMPAPQMGVKTNMPTYNDKCLKANMDQLINRLIAYKKAAHRVEHDNIETENTLAQLNDIIAALNKNTTGS